MGDEALQELFAEFGGRLVSPGGAAALLGVKRETIHTLGKRGRLRIFRGEDVKRLKGVINEGPRWAYVPLDDIERYAEQVGRPFPRRLA
jgi:hypothetical protein